MTSDLLFEISSVTDEIFILGSYMLWNGILLIPHATCSHAHCYYRGSDQFFLNRDNFFLGLLLRYLKQHLNSLVNL